MRLSDKLALEYLKFRNKCEFDLRCIEALLRYFKGEFIFTKEQLANASKEIVSFDMGRFLPLLDKTPKFQLILCDDDDTFPCVNIFRDRIENNLSATFKAGISRDKAIEHFKALFKEAKFIFIYDAHLKTDKLRELVEKCQIKCDICLEVEKYNELNTNLALTQISENIKPDRHHNLNKYNTHDRYIVIDNNIEIILTSGVDNFLNQNKDFTYVIREIKRDIK